MHRGPLMHAAEHAAGTSSVGFRRHFLISKSVYLNPKPLNPFSRQVFRFVTVRMTDCINP